MHKIVLLALSTLVLNQADTFVVIGATIPLRYLQENPLSFQLSRN
jgi:hypothetical protein